MSRQEVNLTFIPGYTMEIIVGQDDFSHGIPPGWIRINFINPAGGVARSQDFPAMPELAIDNEEIVPSIPMEQ